MSSPAEREIRVAVVARLHADLPMARVIHELVCGSNRADLAAVTRDRIVLFEIKSERDTLDRCERQMWTFGEAAHDAVLVAHQRWFDHTPYHDGAPRMAWPETKRVGDAIWAYPEPDLGSTVMAYQYRWTLPRPSLRQPRAATMLGLLWRAELLAECGRHRISCGPRTNMDSMIEQMAWLMTGREIAEAVCRQLRARPFPEADAPIVEDRKMAEVQP